MRNPYYYVKMRDDLEAWQSQIYDDCRYYNDCNICPHKRESGDSECDLTYVNRRIALLEKDYHDNKGE